MAFRSCHLSSAPGPAPDIHAPSSETDGRRTSQRKTDSSLRESTGHLPTGTLRPHRTTRPNDDRNQRWGAPYRHRCVVRRGAATYDRSGSAAPSRCVRPRAVAAKRRRSTCRVGRVMLGAATTARASRGATAWRTCSSRIRGDHGELVGQRDRCSQLKVVVALPSTIGCELGMCPARLRCSSLSWRKCASLLLRGAPRPSTRRRQ
jgi:hypothetical protein